jgi:hypothetical protein
MCHAKLPNAYLARRVASKNAKPIVRIGKLQATVKPRYADSNSEDQMS